MRFRPKTILIQKKAADSTIAKHVQAAHPNAEVESIKFATHSWNGTASSLEPKDFYTEKRRKVAVLARRATWNPDPNGRSTDFLPSVKLGSGCGYFCQYCYVERNKPNSYPKVYDDCVTGMAGMVDRVLSDVPYYRQRMLDRCNRDFEMYRDPNHAPFITFDLGCDTDCVIDNQITRHADYEGHVIELMNTIAELGAMTSFATKGADIQPFIDDCRYPEQNRIRLSLMPEHHRRELEMNTATVEQRLDAANRLVDAGFEVHINLSPIVVTKAFCKEYRALLRTIDEALTHDAKEQMAYEIIFLTHSAKMFEPVKARRPKAHAMMARGPLPLAEKPHKKGVLTYTRKDKNKLKPWLKKAIAEITPYARVRYMF